MAYQLTELAERDIKAILTETLKLFGNQQLNAYSRIIDTGLTMVGDEPERGGSIARPELGEGVRLFHLEHAAGRSGGAAHCIYYTVGRLRNGSIGTIILRLLWEAMEPRNRVVGSLRKWSQRSD